jgi:hypothetical protein
MLIGRATPEEHGMTPQRLTTLVMCLAMGFAAIHALAADEPAPAAYAAFGAQAEQAPHGRAD